MRAPYKPAQVRWLRDSWYEYQAIKRHYGRRTAARSGVPLIQHIHQGLAVMATVGASLEAMKAYCLHPLFQADSELSTVGLCYADGNVDGMPVVLAMEYRHRANAWLSDKVYRGGDNGVLGTDGLPSWGTLVDVKHMLIGDKVQNYSDFLLHHKGSHARSEELELYFSLWFKELGIGERLLGELMEVARSES